MTRLKQLYGRLIEPFNVEGLEIPLSAVKLYGIDDGIPNEIKAYEPVDDSVMICEAARAAVEGQPVLLTVDSIGCVAAAVSFGLVDKDQDEPLAGPRIYTDIMRQQSGLGDKFKPPSPKEFSDGTVYALQDSGHKEYGLFEDDDGRFTDRKTAQAAIGHMSAIEDFRMKGVFLFGHSFTEIDITPDVVVLSVRPVELTRLVQAYAFMTGDRIEASMGPLRAVDSDLIVRPHLTGRINVSPYCLGARLVAGYEAERMGMGVPWPLFEVIVQGMEQSRKGYPFHMYPGAKDV